MNESILSQTIGRESIKSKNQSLNHVLPPINLSKGLNMQPTLISGGLGAAIIDNY
jgi:hypothetical protein